MLIRALRTAGFRVSIAHDGVKAHLRAQSLKPDLILMDVQMPGMDGFATCRLLCANPATWFIPIIFLSDANSLGERLEGLQIGGVDYIAKPCAPEEVIARIRIHLKRRGPEAGAAMEPGPKVPSDDPLVLAAVRYLTEHMRDPPSLSELARLLGTNDRMLSQSFRKHLGQTVFGYLREERLRFSQRLLADTNLSITAISDEVGFSNVANFATAFRARFGKTPSAWRRDRQETDPGRVESA
ncbi:hypothetical protein GCM10023144_14100 [Pigmentiphaga soli]|uniref:DNA-binding response regulator n=1 Tax=Pigmentiphaga soli TaxID=1007095 RepID=A0ABP8GQU0_9BURK